MLAWTYMTINLFPLLQWFPRSTITDSNEMNVFKALPLVTKSLSQLTFSPTAYQSIHHACTVSTINTSCWVKIWHANTSTDISAVTWLRGYRAVSIEWPHHCDSHSLRWLMWGGKFRCYYPPYSQDPYKELLFWRSNFLEVTQIKKKKDED